MIRALLPLLVALVVLAAEALDAARRIHDLLLAREERVASRADFNVDVALVARPRQERVTARAVYAYFIVSRVDCCFHDSFNLCSVPLATADIAAPSCTDSADHQGDSDGVPPS